MANHAIKTKEKSGCSAQDFMQVEKSRMKIKESLNLNSPIWEKIIATSHD